jgi:triacylglycerol lipase
VKKTLLALAFLLALASSASAQEKYNCEGDGPLPAPCASAPTGKGSRLTGAAVTAAAEPSLTAAAAATSPQHVGESGINFDEPNDVRFIRDQQPGQLDTQCRPGVITINLPVTRVISKTDGVPDALVQGGYISETAKLRMPVYDVDVNGREGAPPEVDRISINGVPLGQLTGNDNIWKRNEFDVPIRAVRFAKWNGVGQDPTPGDNVIEIAVSVLGGGWCTAVDWVELSFKATSPIVMIHGNASNPGFFDRQGFTGELQRQGLLFENSVTLPTAQVANNAGELDRQIPGIVRSFGVDSVHFIAHSKGGLDSREYLANYQPRHQKEFKVLSLTTLSTPHNGTTGADLLEARETAARITAEIQYANFPTWTQTIAERMQMDEGRRNLTTTWANSWNGGNLERLAALDLTYSTVAADADTNGNAEIDRNPDEYAELRQEDQQLAGLEGSYLGLGSQAARRGVNALYQFHRTVTGVEIQYRQRGNRTVATLRGVRPGVNIRNDVLVTEPSGLGEGTLAPRVRNRVTFAGPQGRNHSNVANGATAQIATAWIALIEREKGDLK